MRTLYPAVFFMSLSLICLPAYSQNAYMDADNLGQALTMLKTSMLGAELIRNECTSRQPELAIEIENNFSNWKIREKAAIAKADYFWELAQKEQPVEVEKSVEITTLATKKLLEIMLIPGTNLLHDYCQKHFADLASGVWRIRTPNLYLLIDAAPEINTNINEVTTNQ